ncbi:Fe(3+)-hydroxamate ABC transporter permease FhuB [Marinomonas transparens]|uniref:Fe(3+)-hydroxamate ABC transporter permease FhuB n=1 Tax=Marinomonas transparens TaxID=2795388 RepID=A0A934JL44_9GAMM|nr:Fe(3+)-hydroxamate ABC transporter permease FhuB [Marinomonas transparens]MBJ7536368.1 Fe(3+)-hydroxamate ABC transporter permease FhuB [Marinomonas transparens]
MNRSSLLIPFVVIVLFTLLVFSFLQTDSPLTFATQWAIVQGNITQDFDQVDWAFSRLPRLAMALLVGAAMGLIGSVIQQLTRNPLLSPVTLGTSSGAWMGLIILAIVWPEGQAHYQAMAAMIGSLLALGLVLLISGIRQLTGLSIVLAGMAVNLLFGAITTALILLNDQYAQNLFIWGAGDLSQNGWQKVHWLWPHCLIGIAILAYAGKPLTLLKLGQSAAAGRGLNVTALFLILMVSGLWMLSAAITMVGIIGFLGLVSPNLARLLGARTATFELWLSSLLGAMLLVAADNLAILANIFTFTLVPTGLTTALIGAPLLIWLIRQRLNQADNTVFQMLHGKQTLSRERIFIVMAAFLLFILLGVFFHIEQNNYLLQWPNDLSWPLRWPRITASIFAGAAMAVSGVILQRLIHNPLASPDLLGLSAGAILALIGTSTFFGIRLGEMGSLVAFSGSMAVLGLLLLLGRRFRFAAAPMILTGVALSALIETLVQFVLIKGTEDVFDILRWLAGSTYRVTPNQAIILMLCSCGLMILALSLHRWLTLLSMGKVTAAARGIAVKPAFILLLMLAAALCSLVTALVGPITFVSIVAPHLASLLGARHVVAQLSLSALLGATLLQASDWLGQTLIYPNQLAAGTMVAIIGGGYFVILLIKSKANKHSF